MPTFASFFCRLARRAVSVALFVAAIGAHAQSASLAPVAFTNGQFSLDVYSDSSDSFIVQVSTNLVNWTSVATNTAPFTFVDVSAGQYSDRFYRAELLASSGGNPAGELTNGLVAWYLLHGNADDSSTNGNDGYFQGTVTPTNGVDGSPDTAMWFAGGYLTVPGILVQSNSSFSISAWVDPSQLAGNFQAVADCGNLGNGTAGWSFDFDYNNRLVIACGSGGAESAFVFSPGLFYHVVGTAQTGSPYVFHVYVNGVEFAYDNYLDVTNWTQDVDDTQFGRSINYSIYPFYGAMQDIRIYNRVLSPAEVVMLYTNDSSRYVQPLNSVSAPDLIYLKFQDDIMANPPYSYTNWPAPLRDSSIVDNTNVLYYSNEGSNDDVWVNFNNVFAAALHWHGVDGSYANTGDSNHFDFTTNSYTIGLWVEPYTGGGTFLSCGLDGTNGWCVNEDDNYNLFFNTYSNGVTSSIGSLPVHNNAYNAILISVSNGTNVTMYRDGVSFFTGMVNQPAPSGTNTLILGEQNLGPYFGNTLDGNMWMTQIWSTNLSDMDAVYLYLNQQNGTPWP